jgi:hypothetical protein
MSIKFTPQGGEDWAPWLGEKLQQALFRESNLLTIIGGRLFQFLSSLLFLMQTKYGVHLCGVMIAYTIIKGHPELISALGINPPEGASFWERLSYSLRIGEARRGFLYFISLVAFLVYLENLLLILTFVPSVKEKIISLEGDERIKRAQSFFPFQQRLLPPLAYGVPLLTIPFFAAQQGFLWVQLIQLDVEREVVIGKIGILERIQHAAHICSSAFAPPPPSTQH